MYLLSVIIPAYNEGPTIRQLLEVVSAVPVCSGVEKELIVVNDCSTDDTEEQVEAFRRIHPEVRLSYVVHAKNRGKGAALHSGIQKASGDFVIVQDADLEYDPREYSILLNPILENRADVVYGSRFIGGKPHRILFFWHSIGNRFLTRLSNMFTNLNLTDMETCYKMFRAGIIKGIRLRERRFGFEPEVTAKISRLPGIRIYEVGVSYYGRTYADGKKINWKDGVRAVWCIFKYGLFRVN